MSSTKTGLSHLVKTKEASRAVPLESLNRFPFARATVVVGLIKLIASVNPALERPSFSASKLGLLREQ